MPRHRIAIALVALGVLGQQAPTPAAPVLVGAGDIAGCPYDDDEATARLLDSIPGTVFTAGDNVYSSGTPNQFTRCYEPTWGRHKARTRPSPGNHDYETPLGAGYYAYFGDRAGAPQRGYYSYDLGDWHIIALNSNILMARGSPQERWLRADLAAHPLHAGVLAPTALLLQRARQLPRSRGAVAGAVRRQRRRRDQRARSYV
jgi:hypothetical protein